MRQAGFNFLVPDNVHPAPFRLLLARGTYDGANTQRVQRVPFDGEATYVSRLIRHKVILIDISPRGCRFLAKRLRRIESTTRVPRRTPATAAELRAAGKKHSGKINCIQIAFIDLEGREI